MSVIENIAVLALIGGNGIVDPLFDFGHIRFFLRIEQPELLIEEGTEHAATQLAGMLPQVIAFRRIPVVFANGNCSADVFEMMLINISPTLDGFEVFAVARSVIQIHIRIERV
jgi:hypothetical protein